MKNVKCFLLLISVALSFLLSACHEGPAQKKGQSVDNAVENIKDKIENKGPVEKMGEKIDDATGN